MPQKKKAHATDSNGQKTGQKEGNRDIGKSDPCIPSDYISSDSRKDDPFFVVGIGASAGGLEALKRFFSHIPPGNRMAFVVIQHMSPDYRSTLADILKEYTQMHVLQAEDGMKVEPDCIFIKPPDRHVTISNTVLHLVKSGELQKIRHPIDFFLKSLAEDQADKAVGIILSGSGTDGTLGLKAIKDAGGLTIVQDKESAQFNGMPASAITSGYVDYILPVEKMPYELIRYVEHAFMRHIDKTESHLIPKNSPYLHEIFSILQSDTGHSFAHYKHATVCRRIEKRMVINQFERLADYLLYLQQHPNEVQVLFKELLIGVTKFFRDGNVYGTIEKKVIPSLFGNKPPESPVRIWVVGCSTGEEVYSYLMLLVEYMNMVHKHLKIQIFATDINNDALAFARTATYPESIATDVSQKRLKHFFDKRDHVYILKKQYREMVIFANHNLIKDPPFSQLDLVSCRNLFIYLDPVLQKKILPLFHYTLNPIGFLILGVSENIGEFTNLFSAIDVKGNIFQKKDFTSTFVKNFTTEPRVPFSLEMQKNEEPMDMQGISISDIVKKMLLENYTPPSVVINEKYNIMYFHGKTKTYLEPPTGEPSLNIMKMVRKDLHVELMTTIHKAIKTKKTVTKKGIQIKDHGNLRIVNLEVKPLLEPKSFEGLALVLFDDVTPPAYLINTSKEYQKPVPENQYTQKLEYELNTMKRTLQDTVEELEIYIDKYRVAHEMIETTKEELQSTREELETSKEELQSINEELIMVNSELQNKIEELSKANNDINNMLSTTDIGFIFLDRNLLIKRYTPTVTKIINLMETDIGRPIDHISVTFTNKNLCPDIKDVLKTSIPKELDFKTKENTWYLMRIIPYFIEEKTIDGAIIIFINITEQKKIQNEIRFLQNITQTIGESEDFYTALSSVLRRICEATGWVCGEAWIPEPGGKFLELCSEWHYPAGSLDRFHTSSKEFTFFPGVGLPGQAWLSKRPQWIKDIASDINFPRTKIALEAGIRSGLAIPVIFRKEVIAVISFFLSESCEEDERIVKFISSVASQLGLVIQRKRMAEELRKAHDRLEARVEERTTELLKTNMLLKEKIVKQHLMEEKLRKLYQAVEQSPNSIIITDIKGTIEYVNPKFSQVTGYTSDEVIGKNPCILKSGETQQETYKHLWETITSGGEWRGTLHNKKKNGELYWEYVSISPIKNPEGQITHFIAIKEDITEYKYMEDRIKSMAKFPAENPYPVLRIAKDGTIIYANPSSSLLLYQWNCKINQALPDHIKTILIDTLKTKSIKKDIEIRCENKTFSFTIVPVLDANYINLYGVDITGKKQIEETLRKSEARLKNAQRIARLGNWEWNIIKNECYWSEETYRIFGLVPKKGYITYEDFLRTVCPDDREFVTQSVYEAIYEKKPYCIEYRIILPNGTIRVIHTQAEVVFDGAGRAIQMNGINQDVTEQRQIENNLKKANVSLQRQIEELQRKLEERK